MSMPCSAGGGDERAEVLVGAELGVDRVVAAGLVADRVRAAGVAGLGASSVLLRPLRLVWPIGWIGGM